MNGLGLCDERNTMLTTTFAFDLDRSNIVEGRRLEVAKEDKSAPGRPSRVRLADVAAAVGVSRSTASLVQRDSPLVSDATREKVLAAFDEMGYVYNRAASSLRSDKTGLVGVVVTTIGNPFFAEVVDGIESTLAGTGHTAILGQHSESVDSQTDLLNRFMEAGVDGVIITAASGSTASSFKRLLNAGVATVFCVRRVESLAVNYVGADAETAAVDLTRHVLSKNTPSTIAFIGGSSKSSPYKARISGLRAVAAENDFAVDDIVELPGMVSRAAAYEVSKEFFERSPAYPVAVFSYNDVVALGVYAAARELGLRIGRDVLVTGFDDIEAARYEQPPLTTVNLGAKQIGETAARVLNEIAGGNEQPVEHIIPTSLQIRRSCGSGERFEDKGVNHG